MFYQQLNEAFGNLLQSDKCITKVIYQLGKNYTNLLLTVSQEWSRTKKGKNTYYAVKHKDHYWKMLTIEFCEDIELFQFLAPGRVCDSTAGDEKNGGQWWTHLPAYCMDS
jgi:uncharacterized protein with von Willebrand factor type A (vWA) domain